MRKAIFKSSARIYLDINPGKEDEKSETMAKYP
jgi:hypothetical protein